jgi:hypothetical protein
MTPMNRIAALCSLGLTACGGLTPLGSFTDTEIGNYDTGIIDLGTDDLDSDVDDGTDPVVAEGSAPQLLNISAADLGSQISVAFTATDADNNLNGGTFELTVNGATTAYDIPDSGIWRRYDSLPNTVCWERVGVWSWNVDAVHPWIGRRQCR